MLPRAGGQAVVARQRVGVGAHVGGALHVVVAAEDVGAAARHADIAKRQLHDARGAHDRIADGVLGLAHAPHQRAGAVLGHDLGHHLHLRLGHAADFLDLVGRPLGHDLFLDLVHAVDAVLQVLLVFPAVLEDVVQHPKEERDVGTRANAHIVLRLGRGARVARIDHDHLAAVLLGVQQVQHRHRVRLRRVGADIQRRFRVLHIVVRVGHRTVAPGVGHARHRGGVADARLVVGVVGAEERHPLAQQVGLLVAVLGRADEEHRVRAGLLADLLHLRGDLVQRLVPADALVLAVDQLHRVLEPVFAVAVLAQRRALGAVRAQVDGRVEHRLLAHPHAVLDHRVGRAADRAVRAHGALHLDLAGADGRGPAVGGLGLLDQRELAGRQAHADTEAGAPQEGTSVHGRQGVRETAPQTVNEGRCVGGPRARGAWGFSGQKHGVSSG
ncbi:hypothetical protein D3C72_1217760 [compost metagenome]